LETGTAMPKRSAVFAFLLVTLALGSSASAAVSVDLVPLFGAGDIQPGAILTFETRVTSNGGETDNAIFGAIEYPDALINPHPTGSSQTTVFSFAGALNCTTAFCAAFSQISGGVGPVPVGVTNFVIATTTFMVDPTVPLGFVYSFNWRTTPSSQRLDFFGVTNAPGVSFTIPEPTIAALLGVGLVGLALARHKAN